MITLVSPTFLKQRARQLKAREKSLKQNQAYDQAAQEHGFSNYKHYQNVLKSSHKQSKPPIEEILKSIFLENDLSNKMELCDISK